MAAADGPAGLFVDTGVLLAPDDPFTIDAHPFQGRDGTWYLFYARDFLDGDHVGTGIVVDCLTSATSLAGNPQFVVRPHAPWQLYQAQRTMYGRVWDWFTVEGPFVRRRGDTLVCLYSGGSWQEPNYGAHFATAANPLGPWTPANGDVPAVLQSVGPGALGPGHASIVTDDSGADWLVYHAWSEVGAARTMRVDPLQWAANHPRCEGPTLG